MSNLMRVRFEELKQAVDKVCGSCDCCSKVHGSMEKGGTCYNCNERNGYQNWVFDPDRFQCKMDDITELTNTMYKLHVEPSELEDMVKYYHCDYVDNSAVDVIESRCYKATKGPWVVDPISLFIYQESGLVPYNPILQMGNICEIRGWGYLTGKGAGSLGLSDEEAREIQSANADFIASAREDMPLMIKAYRSEKFRADRTEAECDRLREELSTLLNRFEGRLKTIDE